MKCECGGKTQTKETRKVEQGIWRRRKCPACGAEFATIEQRCETLRTPYTSRSGVKREGEIVAPEVPEVRRPTPEKKRPASVVIPPRTDKTYPEPKQVDRLERSARDRIEDAKFERSQKDHGWD